ncbi:helix-turn-helix domain-containing protein [Nonomuraea sp. NPDC050643]|uniref:GlxA family transcriptional regulator n=1 Tax=Nonomuraea sp. NPDC050643 TaxID=3155660 RepID=UPI0033E97270
MLTYHSGARYLHGAGLRVESRVPFRSVVVYAPPRVSSFGLSMVSNIFADRGVAGLPRFEFAVCADRPGPSRTDLGLILRVEHGVEAMAHADLVIVLPADENDPPALPAPVRHALIGAHRRGAIVAGYCTGTFLLAEAGLLDGLRATTNWKLTARLAAEHPSIAVDAEALYVDEGRVVTGAGAAAGIDMCLHLLRREHGTAVSGAVAREAMVIPRRDSGQARTILTSGAGADCGDGDDTTRVVELLAWMSTRLPSRLTVDDLAARVLMSSRTFARRFREVTGTTPQAWLREQRLDCAEKMLETTDHSLEEIAQQVGFGTGAVLRRNFLKRHGSSPGAYRRAFGRPALTSTEDAAPARTPCGTAAGAPPYRSA